MDEHELINKIKSGDREAFNELVALYQTRVIHLAYGTLSDYEDACDAAQEVFIKIYRSSGSFRSDSAVSTWIYRITKNVCFDFLRRKKGKDKVVSLDDDREDAPKNEIRDYSNSPEEISEKNETRRIVLNAISELDENCRLVITMFDLEGMSYEEISAALQIPVGTVKSRLNRARVKLKNILSEYREHF